VAGGRKWPGGPITRCKCIEFNAKHFGAHFVFSRKRVTRVTNGAETWNYVVHWPPVVGRQIWPQSANPNPVKSGREISISIEAQQKAV
jgi:hypothetical protein